ncbi:demethylmenaquinone methyltransferase [Fusarium mundagurra]|uniref:Demethylmenaquinone methyltransferase n=1 Tax=Fusarium mundagurra TaxID=1567541 RepID=A0A8H5Y517_9HYPO|nr:demethylmenaquinone methyltransferase [Fusarium mundagurra]
MHNGGTAVLAGWRIQGSSSDLAARFRILANFELKPSVGVKMTETSKEATSPKAPSASSPPVEETPAPAPAEQTSSEQTTAESPAEPAESAEHFHNPDH